MVGPTGSGKTPLGQLLEKEGLWGRLCLHFDFGEALRVSATQQTRQLTRSERDAVETSLRTGTFLENEHFSIAKKLLVNYLTKRNANIPPQGINTAGPLARNPNPTVPHRSICQKIWGPLCDLTLFQKYSAESVVHKVRIVSGVTKFAAIKGTTIVA